MVRMMVFIVLVGILAAILFPTIREAFQHNVGLNGTIVALLLIGIIYSFRMVWRLFPEVNWVNHFRIADPGLEIPYNPSLLAPMATLLRDRKGPTVLSPLTMRSLLDSLASRLDESRDISRYLIGLLIFLGLLGTFWGLLETVQSVCTAIRSLDVNSQSGSVFEELKRGLEAPLAGMGTSFSSSLFGLAGSLVLGFLDLQASQAQNRFYNELEDWLSSITDIAAGGQAQFGGAAISSPRPSRSAAGNRADEPDARRGFVGFGRRSGRGRQRPRSDGAARRCGAVAGAADARGAADRQAMGANPVGAECRIPPHHRPADATRAAAGHAGTGAA